jgi:hypothetical protein
MSGDSSRGELFARLLPTPEQTLLLRCLLLPREQAAEAWADWLEITGDTRVLLRPGARSVRGLNVALLDALRRNGLDAPPETLSVLKLAALKEEMRSQAYRRVLAGTLHALARHEVPVIVSKGAALAGTAYPHPALRHCHDIDLLVAPAELERAALAATEAGFRDATPQPPQREGSRRLVHLDGLPLELHTRPLPGTASPALVEDWWSAARTVRLSGADTRTASSTLGLLQVCALAFFTPARSSLRWVTDCWHIIHGDEPPGWTELCAAAHHAQLSRCLSVMLGYLASALHAPVPPAVLRDLSDAADGERLGGERALYAVWSTTRRNLATLRWMLGGRKLRGDVLRWALAPSAAYLRPGYASARDRRLLPLAYVQRPLRFALERVHVRLQRRRTRNGASLRTASP